MTMKNPQLVMIAHPEPSGTHDRRRSHRRPLALQLPSSSASGDGVLVVVHDLSSTGLLLETAAKLKVGSRCTVELPDVGARAATVLWNSGRYFGCQFDVPISKGAVSAALLKNPAAESRHLADDDDLAVAASRDEGFEKLPLRTRLWILVAVGTVPSAIIVAVIAWLW